MKVSLKHMLAVATVFGLVLFLGAGAATADNSVVCPACGYETGVHEAPGN